VKRSLLAIFVCLCPTGVVHALGLGEASVRSSLGQPLHAVVELIDVPTELTADCFRLAPASVATPTPTDARLAFVRTKGQTALHIRTPDSINDPVIQFVLDTDCDVRMQREYTLLLDPPVLVAPIDTPVPQAATPQAAASQASMVARAPTHEATPASARADKPAARVKRAAPATGATPRLVLSGKRHFAGGPESRFALQLDTTLPDPTRIGQPGEPLTPTELSDENTALTRKLLHLETQLRELHQRNAELEARQVARPANPPATPPTTARWPLALLLLGLLAGLAVLVVWLRRRAQAPVADPLTAISPIQPLDAASAVPEIWRMADDDSRAPAPVPARMAERAPVKQEEEGTEVKEDILDQAEVFMAHGHGDFAIHLLQEHLRAAPMESPVPWLLLLDLQYRAGDTGGYAASSADCRRYFNINLSGHPISQDGNEPGPGLEAYPHLLDRLVAVWNTPDVDAFINELIYDDRGGTRMGFEPGAYRDILLLRDVLQQVQCQPGQPRERAAAA
jgi:hypothetical protein